MTPGGLQPSPHWWGHTRKQQTACATCLSKSSMAPTVLHHHNDKDPPNLAPFLCPHLSLLHHSKLYKAALPKVLRAFKLCTEDFHTTVQKLTHERSVKNGWDWRERHLALYPRMDLHLLKSIPCPLQCLQYQFICYTKSLRLTVKISPGGRWQACAFTARA